MAVDTVTLVARDRGLSVTGDLGDGPAQLQGGIGGWEVVTRPGKRPLTVWRGPGDALGLSIAVVFDGHRQDRSVELECRILEMLGGIAPGDPEPPRIEVHGPAIPHSMASAPGTRWVISGVEWGDVIRRRSDGHRVRQAVSVSLLRYVEDRTLERVRARGKHPKYRYTSARKGDTFEKIAARALHSKRLGGRLARLNGKRSPDVKLKQGRRVKLPSAATAQEWKRDLKRRR